MKPDFSDLRFVDSDGVNLLPYWIESYNTSSAAFVWVKIPSIPSSTAKTIYMYYGNPSAASASDGTATFDFFDDFNTGSINSGLSALTKYSGNPVMQLTSRTDEAAAFSSIVKSGSVYNAYISYHDPSTGLWRLGHMISSDGVNYVEDVTHDPVLPLGGTGKFDSAMMWTPIVWIEGINLVHAVFGQ